MIGHKAILKMGNPLLREVSKPLLKKEVLSKDTKAMAVLPLRDKPRLSLIHI